MTLLDVIFLLQLKVMNFSTDNALAAIEISSKDLA